MMVSREKLVSLIGWKSERIRYQRESCNKILPKNLDNINRIQGNLLIFDRACSNFEKCLT